MSRLQVAKLRVKNTLLSSADFNLKNIDKLVDAHMARTAKFRDCTLILIEGDSAMRFAVAKWSSDLAVPGMSSSTIATGRFITKNMVIALEYVGLAPKGSQRDQSFLKKAAEGLVGGGK
uniref:Cycloartenol-C-24-methyltransferase-like n=1 Tax=Tanacetum cinerariifolium TaxID=118510 RepID=A0A6L2P1K6_TANCI|nr:cycloartenol-C-24-methyltransferase-like [Tanacetum cinerariifolium]